ncbi:MAG TPA: TIGR00282 family metallophosphoesterase [Opitutales bacterium]|nr:TIGR00282 family metallophosphoesterase [Opitutales bacterium]
MPKLLFIGDIVGRPGRELLKKRLPEIRETHALDFVVANGENAASGSGITAAIVAELTGYGVDVVTLGDHIWDQRGFDKEIGELANVVRPANLPKQCPGRDFVVVEKNGVRLGVCTLLGNAFMKIEADSAFHMIDSFIERVKGSFDALFVEVHAEATSEKIAMGWYLDGRATLVAGTHTHIPTADETILPHGTAYITDVGMTGPYASVLGREIPAILGKFLDGMPRKWEIACGDVRICGCIAEFTPKGRATAMTRICVRE